MGGAAAEGPISLKALNEGELFILHSGRNTAVCSESILCIKKNCLIYLYLYAVAIASASNSAILDQVVFLQAAGEARPLDLLSP